MESVFSAEDIAQVYGRRQILTACTILADRGECVGIAGRNGSGKSTLLQVLAGVRRPHRGTVRYEGRVLSERGSGISRIAGYVPQTNPLIEELSAADNLRLLSGRIIRKEDPVLSRLRIGEFFGTKVSRLSGGMKRRLAVASALVNHPPVLVMDEPTSALDLYHKSIIYEELASFTKEGGIVIMATHDIEEMNLCSRLYLITGGSAKECLPEEAIQSIKGE